MYLSVFEYLIIQKFPPQKIIDIVICGLRISEVIQLRMVDIHYDEGYVFVKASKGKRDRKTVLSPYLIALLEEYIDSFKPGLVMGST